MEVYILVTAPAAPIYLTYRQGTLSQGCLNNIPEA